MSQKKKRKKNNSTIRELLEGIVSKSPLLKQILPKKYPISELIYHFVTKYSTVAGSLVDKFQCERSLGKTGLDTR